jgi:tripartite-type tricarboxylate transporter receptor subunit TctC
VPAATLPRAEATERRSPMGGLSMTSRMLGCISAALALFVPGLAAQAQEFPTRTVTIVVPLAAGTGMDSVVRIYAEELQKTLGKPVVIENQPGAALMLAAQRVATATPDGHTLVVSTSSPMAINQTLYKKVNYDPEKDFVPLSLYLKSPFVLLVGPNLGTNSVKEFISKAQTSEKPFTYGTPGAGTLLHLVMELMKRDFKFKADHVPYRNSPQIVTDVIGGHISSAVSETGAAMTNIKSGNVKALGITSDVRHPALPDVPTMAEAAGLPGFEAVSWHVLLAPSATPKPIVERLQKEMARITGNDAFQKRVSDIGLMPLKPMSEAEMLNYMAVERVRWGGVVKDLGLAGTQ